MSLSRFTVDFPTKPLPPTSTLFSSHAVRRQLLALLTWGTSIHTPVPLHPPRAQEAQWCKLCKARRTKAQDPAQDLRWWSPMESAASYLNQPRSSNLLPPAGCYWVGLHPHRQTFLAGWHGEVRSRALMDAGFPGSLPGTWLCCQVCRPCARLVLQLTKMCLRLAGQRHRGNFRSLHLIACS